MHAKRSQQRESTKKSSQTKFIDRAVISRWYAESVVVVVSVPFRRFMSKDKAGPEKAAGMAEWCKNGQAAKS